MPKLDPKILSASLGLCVVAGYLVLPVSADDKGVRAGTRVQGWGKVIDPDGDCEIKAGDDGISIKLPGTRHDFAAELRTQNAPRVLSEIKGDFIAEVKVSGKFAPGPVSNIEGRRPYHGAGLLLIKDKDNYISLHRGSVTLDDKTRHYANFELRQDGEMAVSNYEIEIPDEDTYLRLERRGNQVYNATSPDGVHWSSYDPITLKLPETVEFGIVGITSSEVPLAIQFKDLTVFRKAKVD